MSKYGFIGGGNMGGAMAGACKKAVGAENVLLVDRDEETTARLAQSLGVTASSYDQIARECRLIFVGVKPGLVAQVLEALRPALQDREDDVAVVSIAAGVKIEDMSAWVGENTTRTRRRTARNTLRPVTSCRRWNSGSRTIHIRRKRGDHHSRHLSIHPRGL